MALNFAHTTVGWTSVVYIACEEKPQSAPAMTFSRPTSRAKRMMRSAMSLGMLDDIAGMRDHARHEHFSFRHLHTLEQMIFVLVTWIGRLEAVGAGIDLQHIVDDVGERGFVDARPLVNSIAGVEAHIFGRDAVHALVIAST